MPGVLEREACCLLQMTAAGANDALRAKGEQPGFVQAKHLRGIAVQSSATTGAYSCFASWGATSTLVLRSLAPDCRCSGYWNRCRSASQPRSAWGQAQADRPFAGPRGTKGRQAAPKQFCRPGEGNQSDASAHPYSCQRPTRLPTTISS